MKTENNKLKTDLENVNDILSRHCVANERKFIQYDANHKLFNQQTKAIEEFNFNSYTTSVQRIEAEIERFNKLQASLQKQVNELKLSTQKSCAEKVSTEIPARTSNQPFLKQVNSIPNRSIQQTKISIPVCSPVTDLQSEVNKSTNGNISPLSTPKSYTNTHSDSHKDNGLREIDKQLSTTYKIPVRLDGVTENIDTSPADSDENFFTGVKRKRTARYYLSGINPKSTRSGILAYLEKENVHVTYLRLFNTKHSAQRVSAKLNVVENCADYVESHNFWPDGGYTCIGKAEDLPNKYHAYHGKGGVAILYKNTLQFSVSEIHDINSERVVGLQIKTKSNGSIFIFGAYLPSDDSIDNYRNELNMLDTLVSYYCNYGSVIVAGDLNVSCRTKDRLHSNHCKSDELQTFVKRHDLLFSGGKIKHTGPDYTFITKKTMIDYFLVNKSVLRQLRSCEILDEGSISSTSDHLPIIVELLIDNNPHRIMNSYSKFPAWHKINDEHIRNYQDSMDVPIELLTGRINSDNVDVDTVNTEIESILHAAADSVIPKCVFNPYTKPYWTPDVKKAHQTERSMRKRWLADGRPRGMS
ncbi:Hypothetical predicted protein [Mytilus galloprovincialis]|uniref:Endonuclease/exonuclease/phosphatase domain-containing protein n=1 Tax=Mytilus galloprovincialis TaxID=29158 RepID=A0A8B6FUW6_MYTGA|nr:Hypothetical predicted protein [Mytilus galloprovincialis]